MQDAPLAPDLTARLIDAARTAAAQAHAPYSNFKVGAAVLDEAGGIHSGCNVENASFGLTVCAERNAVAAAVLAGARRLRAVAIFTPTHQPTPPCGACRQVLAEFGGETMDVIMSCHRGEPAMARLGELLPAGFQFRPEASGPSGNG